MSPSRLHSAIVAAFFLAPLMLRGRPARAQEQERSLETPESPPPDPRFSLRAAGAAGLSTARLGTSTVGGSLEGDIWGRTLPLALGFRVGGLASGWGDEARHGTLYGGLAVTRYLTVGAGRFLFSATLGFAVLHGADSGATNTVPHRPLDEAGEPILIVRAGYLVPVGAVRLGIALDAVAIPGEGTSLLAAPMLDVPF